MKEISVMLGDATVTKQKTFDPTKIQNYFENINNKLKEWNTHDVTITNNEDIRRIFTKFEIKIANYLLSGHLSVQFHVLLYYKPEQRVIDCQKELGEIIDLTKNKEEKIANESDQFILDKLKDMGYKEFDHQQLFEILYENDELREKVYDEINQNAGIDFQKLSQRKSELFKELDSLLLETYQTSPVLIDDARLVTGEEGCLCTFDIEYLKGKTKEGIFDPTKITTTTKQKILEKLDEISQILTM
ncbi:MAG: hypothetical protein R3327_07300 [Nitrosopumilaceae archaeon]|nr:hypothetical protein [Nitrosopumilaceae archaeon]